MQAQPATAGPAQRAISANTSSLGSSGIDSQVLEFLEPLETIETNTVIPPNLGFVQLAGVDGTVRPTDASGSANPALKEASHLWKDMNRDVMDSNIFRRAIHPPKDTYEPYNPPQADEDAAAFADRPVASTFKPKKPTTPTFNVYDVQHRGFQHGIKSNHYDDDFHPDYATGFGGAVKGVNYGTSAEESMKDQVKAQAKELEKQDVAAKDAAIVAKAGVPESEKAAGARKEIKEEKEEAKVEKKTEAKEAKKAALFQRVALAQGTPLPIGYRKPKDGIVRPTDAGGRIQPALEHVEPLWREMNTDVMGSNQFKRRWAAPKDNYEPYSPPDAEAEAKPFEDRPVAASWKKKTPEELDPPMEPGIKEAIEAMKKHEKEAEDKTREDKLKAIDEVTKDDADVYKKRVAIIKKKHEKKAKARTEAAAKGKVLPPDSESSDEDDLVHPVKAGETVMDKIAPQPKEQKAASLAQDGFLIESPRQQAPVKMAAEAKAPAPAKAEAKPNHESYQGGAQIKEAQAEQQQKEKEQAEAAKLTRESKLAKMNPEEKAAFLKQEEEEHHEHAEHPKNTLWVEGPAHDCDYDPNSASPLASCRRKNPPKDNFKPYVGAA